MIHLLCRPSRVLEGPEVVLGAIVDQGELATLQNDPDAMPVGAYLVPIAEHYDAGPGEIACQREGLHVRAPVRTVADVDAYLAVRDASIAAMHPEVRAEVFPGHKAESEHRAERQAKAVEAARVMAEKAAAASAAKAAADAEFDARVEAAAARLVAKQTAEAAKGKP
jgi:hypothetical protein